MPGMDGAIDFLLAGESGAAREGGSASPIGFRATGIYIQSTGKLRLVYPRPRL